MSGLPHAWHICLPFHIQIRTRNCAFLTVLRWCLSRPSSFKIASYWRAEIDWCVSRYFFILVFTFSFNQPWNRDLGRALKVSRLEYFLPIIYALALTDLTCQRTGLLMEGDNDKPLSSFLRLIICWSWLTFPQEQSPIAILQYNGCIIKEFKREIIGFSSDLNFAAPGVVIKWSWSLRRPGALDLPFFTIVVVFSAHQDITILFLPAMVMIH